jgi:hypothetical protein
MPGEARTATAIVDAVESVDVAMPRIRPRWPARMFAVLAVGAVAGFAVAAVRAATPSAKASVAPTKQPPPKPSKPYDALAGTWRGTGHQFEPDTTWTIAMTLDKEEADVGQEAGTIEYPSLGCSGVLVRKADIGQQLVVEERITHNPHNECVARGEIHIYRNNDRLVWNWYFETGEYGAEAKLTR